MKFSRWAIATLACACFAAAALAQGSPTPTPASGSKPGATAPATPAKPKPSLARSAASSSGRLDGVAAVVNNEVVLQSDVDEQAEIVCRQSPEICQDSATVDTIRHQVLEQLVNEKLIVAEAKKQGVTVTETEVMRQVDQAIADAKQRLGGEEGYRQQLRLENTTESRLRDKYRAEIERQLIAERMRDRIIPRKSVIPTQSEAEAYFKTNPGKFPKRAPEVKLSVIQIPVTPDSISDRAAREKILAIRKRITSGERFAKVAAEVSEDPGSARSGGDLGYFVRGQMDPAFETAAFSLPPGKVSDPIHSLFGWHLIEVLERDTVKTTGPGGVTRDSLDAQGRPAIETHARHILVRVATGEPDVRRAFEVAERVQGQAVKGTDFATLVKRYSRYQGQQSPDGDIGFVPLSSLQPNIRAGLDTLEIGEVSPVLQNAVGFNIFKITDRRPERPFQLEEIREELVGAVAQLRFREKFEEWVKGLRSKAHVVLRM